MNKIEQIERVEQGRVLGELTTFGMGGPADYFCEVRDVSLIPRLIEACLEEEIPYVLLGWGSNMVFHDRGFRGLVIHNLARNLDLEGDSVVADAGALVSQVIQFSLKNGLTGMEKLIGMPGTIGGAVRGNAGAFGLEIKDVFEKALVYEPGVGKREISHHELQFGYRESVIKGSPLIILKVWIRLRPGDTDEGVAEVRRIIASRAGKHPAGKSAGSFFKNPSGNSVGEGLSAGYMNDQCGFKGFKVGGAFISEKHANFLMNDGSATMEDVLGLCGKIEDAVEERFGIRLEREVQLIGESGVIDGI